MKRLTTCLWFTGQAAEAAKFYTSIFKKSKMGATTHYGPGMPMPEGTVLTVDFELDGRPFMALNGDANFPYTEAMSLVVNCKDQKEIDYYWKKLTAGGKEVQCGWLKDKHGISWQVVPEALDKMIKGKDKAKENRMMQALMGMIKIDLAALKKAYDGK